MKKRNTHRGTEHRRTKEIWMIKLHNRWKRLLQKDLQTGCMSKSIVLRCRPGVEDKMLVRVEGIGSHLKGLQLLCYELGDGDDEHVTSNFT